MTLPTLSLPSKGYKVPFEFIEVTPLTLKEMSDFQIFYERSTDIIQQHLILIEKLIMRNPNLVKLPLVDMYALLGITCYTSTTSEYLKQYQIDFNCPSCKSQQTGVIDLNSIECRDISDKLKMIESVVFNGKSYYTDIPTIERFHSILTRLSKIKDSSPETKLKVAFVASLFKETQEDIISVLANLTLDDISLFEYLFVLVCNPIKDVVVSCKKCKGGAVSVDVLNKLTNLFRCVSKNTRFDATKVNYIQGLPRDGEPDSASTGDSPTS